MDKVKKSKLWFIEQNELERIVKESKTLAEVCKAFGFAHSGAQHKQVKRVLTERAIDFSHIPLGLAANKGRVGVKKNRPLSEILIKGINLDGRDLKKRLIKEGLLQNKCNRCPQGPVWNGLPLTLQLEHINGDHYDNRIENLEILCPNCHTQTKTWGYKKRGTIV